MGHGPVAVRSDIRVLAHVILTEGSNVIELIILKDQGLGVDLATDTARGGMTNTLSKWLLECSTAGATPPTRLSFDVPRRYQFTQFQ